MGLFAGYEKMAMLDLPGDERALLEGRFEEITAGFAALDSVDTSGVLPLVTVLESTNVMREDEAYKLFEREVLLRAAPEQNDGYFQVPAAID